MVRRTLAVLVLVAGVAANVTAQNAWQAEIGVQGGYTHFKPAGTGADDGETLIMLPGASVISPLLTYGSLYAIIPWKDKLAFEPTLGFSQFNLGASATAARIGLRLNYAVTPKFYAGAGGVLNYVEAVGSNGTQLGLQFGVGYRHQLTAGLNGRIEAQWVSAQEAENVTDAFNAYSLLVGVSSRIGARPATRARAPAASTSRWTRAVGVSGGYSRVHIVSGGADLTALTLPGLGGSLAAIGGSGAWRPGPPLIFAVFPVGRAIALEPGLDITSVDPGTGSTLAAALGLRLNYAVTGGWYGAVGGQLTHVSEDGGVSTSVLGGTLAWGYRFRLTGNLGGRVELNYLANPRNDDLGMATNTFSVLFGVLMPLR